ncbi:hypothetical protein EDD18DRAFT_1108207 [Armillaria luteobubalina]|uniref:Uncharacterized protein n=1 Tax=Armillaria luteobubalina TaxID=153913 RepID=A0AA39Q1D3_9AGAR|nr:hypothetical protein EDD18DRAFT_1108207 [Armillaria luteobubalina]
MATETYPAAAIPELTDSQIKNIFADLDNILNRAILSALLYGIYTGIVAVTLWAVVLNLHGEWAMCISVFTTLPWKSVWETYSLSNMSAPVALTVAISGILSTIWRCWIVWGRSWRVVLVPIACTTLATGMRFIVHTASRGIVAYYDAFGALASPQAIFLEEAVNWAMLYASLIMATLLWCTILIIYRILRVGGTAGRIHVYQRVIEMLVESALLYSVVLVVLLVFEARNERAAVYIEDLAIAMRGIIPTMLAGRVAAGHARPDDSWNESTPRSSIRFGSLSTSQNDTQVGDDSSTKRHDLEVGLEDSTKVRVEGAAPIDSTHDYYHVVGTSSSVDYSVV